MHALTCSGGIFDYAVKQDRLKEVELELAEPSVWDEPEKAQALGRERASLEAVVTTIEVLDAGCDDASDLLDLAVEEDDEETAQSVEQDRAGLESELEKLEFRRMFSGETDPNNAYLDIQAGSGGTEAQDWAEMLQRMYSRWAERRGEWMGNPDGDRHRLRSRCAQRPGKPGAELAQGVPADARHRR